MKSRKLLMIPGPVEFEPAVMRAMGAPTTSHVASDFIETFGRCLEMMREVWLAPSGQPVILAGSGTLAMDAAGANLVESGDKALVISTGYFGERYANLLERYGAKVTVLRAETGEVVDPELIDRTLSVDSFKLMTFTHVDTSTAVRVDPVAIGRMGKKHGVLTILDGVCSVAGEEIRQDEWGIDVVLTASQKAVGVPPGLALLMFSPEAIRAFKARKTLVGNYYADLSHWIPIMEAYEGRKPSYFGTPAVNLVAALEVSLTGILREGMGQRFERHRMIGRMFREGLKSLGLEMIPKQEEISANTLSAPFFPAGVEGPAFLRKVNEYGIILAGGLLPEIKTRYFRIGHMGSVNRADTVATLDAIRSAL
jgi:alanine-glyoxylate transaminase/serine-glyoxylate transaminase/serine-pyruvate transaminase